MNIESISKILHEFDRIVQHKYLEEDNIGVLSGRSGMALFEFYYSKQFGLEKNHDIGVEILESCFEKVNQGYSYHTYCTGIGGFAWTVNHLAKNDFLEIETDKILSDLDHYLISVMLKEIENKNFDFLHGAIGIGLYVIDRLQNTTSSKNMKYYEDALTDFLVKLEEVSESDEDTIRWRSVIGIDAKEDCYNLSLSHGNAAVIGFLSKLSRISKFQSTASMMLRKATNFMLSFEDKDERAKSIFPNWIGFKSGENRPSRLSWCYGDLGIGLSLFHASEALGDLALQKKSISILEKCVLRKSFADTTVIDAGICHGSFGISKIYQRLFKETGLYIFKESSDFWIIDGLKKANHSEGFGGYKKWDGLTKQWMTDLSVLEGISGIGLVLLDNFSNLNQTWDECLLIS